MNLLSYLYPKRLAHVSTKYNTSIDVWESGGRNILRVNGIEQSGPYTEKLWNRAMPWIVQLSKNPKHILILGVGGGTLYYKLAAVYPDAHIVGVDIDAQIIKLAKTYFGLGQVKSVQLVAGDARSFVRRKHKFDLVVIDLYTGNDVPDFVTTDAFLKDLKQITKKGGLCVFNYFSYYKQKEKSAMLLDKVRRIYQSVFRDNNLHNVFYYCQ